MTDHNPPLAQGCMGQQIGFCSALGSFSSYCFAGQVHTGKPSSSVQLLRLGWRLVLNPEIWYGPKIPDLPLVPRWSLPPSRFTCNVVSNKDVALRHTIFMCVYIPSIQSRPSSLPSPSYQEPAIPCLRTNDFWPSTLFCLSPVLSGRAPVKPSILLSPTFAIQSSLWWCWFAFFSYYVKKLFKLWTSPVNNMPYDTHGGGHRGELRLYCPKTEVKFSEMTSGATWVIEENFTSVWGQY